VRRALSGSMVAPRVLGLRQRLTWGGDAAFGITSGTRVARRAMEDGITSAAVLDLSAVASQGRAPLCKGRGLGLF